MADLRTKEGALTRSHAGAALPIAGSWQGKSSVRRDIERVRRDRAALIGLSVVAVFVLSAALAPAMTRYDPNAMHPAEAEQPPSQKYWFGTDWAGRDIYSRVLYGGRVSLAVGLIAVGIATAVGVPLGLIAGYYGGLADELIMRAVDVVYAFPFIVLAIAIMAFVGQSLWNVMLVLGLVSWVGYARIVRAQTLAIRETQYVEAAKALGASDLRILAKHVLPNTLTPIIVYATLSIPFYIIAEASLGFLGLGAQPGTATWGSLLSRGRDSIMRGQWWITAFPGLAIVCTVIGFNLFGDGLRDALHPKGDETRGLR